MFENSWRFSSKNSPDLLETNFDKKQIFKAEFLISFLKLEIEW